MSGDAMNQAWSVLEIRSVDEEKRIIEGIASTASVDDYDTVLEPRGARFELPLPLLWMHRQDTPVGHVISATLSDNEITIRAKLEKITEPGTLKDDADRAWHAVKSGLVRGLSVGFLPRKKKGNRFTEWAWKELSLVTLPANVESSILAVRSADIAIKSPVVSGTPVFLSPVVSGTNDKRRVPMTIQDQITQHENSRAAKVAQQSALMEAAGTEGRTFDSAEAETYDTLTEEVRSIDGHLVRLAELKRTNVAAAVAVPATPARPGVPYVRVTPNTAPGIGFARYVMSLVACNGVRSEAAMYARERWGDAGEEIAVQHRNAMLQTRAPVAPGTTVQATFAAPLVHVNFMEEMLELLRASTLVERIPGLRKVPFNVSMPAQTAGGTYKWVGEGKLKPVTNAQFASVTLGMFKASGIIVLTEELVRSSAPSAELVVRNELRDGITRFLDLQFIDPAVAAVAATNPASITNGVAGTVAGGTTEAFARSDLRALIKTFVTNDIGLDGVVLLMNQSVAFTLGTIVNSVGAPAFPGITAAGGNILGIPVVTSNTITAAMGIIAVHAPSILLADEGGIEIDISREASLQLDSAPTDPADATAVYTSLWQANLVGLRVERYISWGKARATAVDRIHTVAYA